MLSKQVKTLLGMTITAVVFSIISSMPVFGGVKAYSNGTAVNIRAEANTSSEVLGRLNTKDPVVPTGVKDGFIKIDYEGAEAYVFAEYVTFESDDAFVNKDGVEIKANKGNETIGQLNSGDVITVTGRYKEYLLFSNNGEIAFVHSNHVDSIFKGHLPEVPEDKLPVTYAKVISDSSLNLREGPSTETGILAQIRSGDVLDVVEKGSDWTKVRTSDEKTGYVSSEFVDIKTGIKPPPAAATRGAEVVAYAKQFIGTPYVYGGTNLNSGVDCSGFVQSVYKNFGINLNRTASTQPANGVKVSKSELVAGDLVFFSNGGMSNIQHVGIYCGDGTFIHSASGRTMAVTVSGLSESYYVTNYITAARIFR